MGRGGGGGGRRVSLQEKFATESIWIYQEQRPAHKAYGAFPWKRYKQFSLHALSIYNIQLRMHILPHFKNKNKQQRKTTKIRKDSKHSLKWAKKLHFNIHNNKCIADEDNMAVVVNNAGHTE